MTRMCIALRMRKRQRSVLTREICVCASILRYVRGEVVLED
jgi:hypothetical protein